MTSNRHTTAHFSDVGLLVSNGARIILVKPSKSEPEVLRVHSAAAAAFDIHHAKQFVGFDDAVDGWVLLPLDFQALKGLRELIGAKPFKVATAAPLDVRSVIAAHLKLQDTVQEYCGVTAGRELPKNILRLYNRLGIEGHLLVGAPMTFDKGRTSFRLAVRSYQCYKALQQSKKPDDELIGQLLAWNIIAQSHIALEKFCALLRAIAASRVAPDRFCHEYLRFGRAESDLHSSNVTNVMTQILGRHGAALISDALGIPLSVDDLQLAGLADCGVEPNKLIGVGRSTRDILVERFRNLARIVIEGRTPTGRTLKSIPAKAYGAFRHGFAAGFPAHLPNGYVFHGAPERFANERDFLEYHRKANSKAEIMFLGEPDVNGNRAIENVRPIIRLEELKVFVRVTYWASFWTYELAKYARSLFGSVDLRFPYLVNAKQSLSEEESVLLQARVDALEGIK